MRSAETVCKKRYNVNTKSGDRDTHVLVDNILSIHTLLEVLDVTGSQGDTNAVDPIRVQ